jgi:hypothetical protein
MCCREVSQFVNPLKSVQNIRPIDIWALQQIESMIRIRSENHLGVWSCCRSAEHGDNTGERNEELAGV